MLRHYNIANELFVLDHGIANPSDAEWNGFIEDVRPLIARTRPKLLIRSQGGAPDASQRARVAEAYGVEDPDLALLSDSPFAHALVTAFRWLGLAKRTRVFRYDETDAALDFLALTGQVRAEADRLLHNRRQVRRAG